MSETGFNYYLLSTTNLAPPVVWTTNSITAGTGGLITGHVPGTPGVREQYVRYLAY